MHKKSLKQRHEKLIFISCMHFLSQLRCTFEVRPVNRFNKICFYLKFENCSALAQPIIHLTDLKSFVHNAKLYFLMNSCHSKLLQTFIKMSQTFT